MTPPTAIHALVERCRAAEHPGMVARLRSGWVVMGERQVLPGYCLLLPDPVVPHLNALAPGLRAEFLADMAAVGDALLAIAAAARINYALFGNVEPAPARPYFSARRLGARARAHRATLGPGLERGADLFRCGIRRLQTALGGAARAAAAAAFGAPLASRPSR